MADVERVDREVLSRTERMRASAGNLAEVERITGQMAQAPADRARRLEEIQAMSPRALVLEYVREAGWTG